ncbi:MAG TPA: cyclic pyranopterin monophosphate synthase MoaC [Xanthomonadales bacterium]|nr:cyclic pyranopterin monophosphate synthase MoaC [Xanthomonadales bacterium]
MSEDKTQHWSMADVSGKAVTRRLAIAGGRIIIGAKAMAMLQAGTLPKGDPRAMAEVAGIQGAKQTPSLIPLCHPISLNRVMLRSELRPEANAIDMYCLAEIAAQTGVEMEALTGLNIALLTLWDLIKPVEPALEISDVRLLYKSGGKSGVWKNPSGLPQQVEQWIAEAAG